MMDFEKNYNDLIKQVNLKEEEGLTFNLNLNARILPFLSRNRKRDRPNFENGIPNIMGEVCRIISNKSINNSINYKEIIDSILNKGNIKFSDEGDKRVLRHLIEDYLQEDEENLKIFNPLLFLYINESPNPTLQDAESDAALFLYEIFFKDNILKEKFKSFLYDYESNDLIVDMIFDNLPELSELSDDKIDSQFVPVLKYVIDAFREDILFLLDKHPNYLLENIESIFIFYYFYYTSQLILKIGKDFTADLLEPEELYYALDWESVRGQRKTLKRGYNLIEKSNKELLAQIYLIDQLNILMGSRGLLLNQLNEKYESLPKEEKEEFLKIFERWGNDFHNARHIKDRKYDYKLTPTNDVSNFKKLANFLYCGLSNREKIEKEKSKDFKGIGEGMRSRYSKYIFEIGYSFKKPRRNHGNVLNLNQDMFLIITSLCIKEPKIKLTTLYDEYEKRGLFFDKHSKEEIENFLNKLNYIDKKSDSEEAQYVRSIL